MTAQQLDQQLTDTKLRLDGAARARFVSTGGADEGLAWALEFWGGDLEQAGWNRDPRTWSRAMAALRALVAQQQ